MASDTRQPWYQRWKDSQPPAVRKWLSCHPVAEEVFEEYGDQGYADCWAVITMRLPAACTSGPAPCEHWAPAADQA